ncbi:hypothetical protein NDU88_002953 [Pleurodeles waltl]|uniref:Uncharacterized protein n=1 Tax=Pleurodeles waltl TaxID=8319 RepID=A0AAV7TNC5_PLEWA|nr:hypothetical protein NDU88_002953 [Pleurodeles waltl]
MGQRVFSKAEETLVKTNIVGCYSVFCGNLAGGRYWWCRQPSGNPRERSPPLGGGELWVSSSGYRDFSRKNKKDTAEKYVSLLGRLSLIIFEVLASEAPNLMTTKP